MARIVEGDAGKVICKEAARLRPAAVVMGTRGRSLIQRLIPLSLSLSLYIHTNTHTHTHLYIVHYEFMIDIIQLLMGEIA